LLRTYRALLDVIGWDRKARPAGTLDDYLREEYGAAEAQDEPDVDDAATESDELSSSRWACRAGRSEVEGPPACSREAVSAGMGFDAIWRSI
jgi:hypothetical protein